MQTNTSLPSFVLFRLEFYLIHVSRLGKLRLSSTKIDDCIAILRDLIIVVLSLLKFFICSLITCGLCNLSEFVDII